VQTYKTIETNQYLLFFNSEKVSLRRALFYNFNLYNSSIKLYGALLDALTNWLLK